MEGEGQDIFHYKVRLSWKVKRGGSSYVNHTKGNADRPYEFVSRANGILELNSNPEIIFQMMVRNGLEGKKVFDFCVDEVYEQKKISESFFYKK